MLQLVRPALEHLPSYKAALEQGWSPDNVSGEAARLRELARIAENPQDFVDLLDDRDAKGGPITLPDGSQVQRLPGFRRWIWDGEFCGSLGFRWRPGGNTLPEHVLGHLGYSTVPWKRGFGYTKRALGMLLDEIRPIGLDYVEITTQPDNIASQKVILANGGVLVERFTELPAYGGHEALRYRISLAAPSQG